MKRILLTSSKGFIGSNLFSFLEKRGFDVLGLDEDIRDKEAMRPYFLNADLVVHTAGETQEQNNEELCHATNVVGTRNVVELCVEYGCKLIHLSSTARKLAYGRSKQEAQKLVEKAKGLKVVVLRLCPIVKRDDPLMVPGKRYALEDLITDIEYIMLTNDFDNFKLIDYENKRK
jgi:nucleoside-diphosphate-sugar epimerase